MSEETSSAAPQSISDLTPKMRLEGTVKRTTIHGAIVDIGVERAGLVHISQLAPARVNRVEDATKKRGYRLAGDVDFEAVKEKASLITPVPGGVGPMTITMLLYNTVASSRRRLPAG